MKKTKFIILATAIMFVTKSFAQQDVTFARIINPNFEARFSGWINNGFFFVTNNSFSGKSGGVYMERWVTQGLKVPNVEIYQNLTDLPTGIYTLSANCQNIQQADANLVCTGATFYAGDKSVEVNKSDTYSLTFTVLEGKTKIGIKTISSTGNWVSIDNLKLVFNGINTDSLHSELQKVIDKAQLALNGGTGVETLQSAIDNAKVFLTSDSRNEISDAAKKLDDAIIAYKIVNASGPIPEVLSTNEFIPTGSTVALGRFIYRSNGAMIIEKGFCWSTSDEPTIFDDRSAEKFINRNDIYRLDRLKPSTIYYVRPYMITRGYQVVYGKTLKIATLPMGNMTYSYDNGGSTEENYRITSALEETKWLYNNLTYVRGINLDVHYGSETPTADCSYGGYMRVGPNSSYQQTGTILHEASHGVGVGTSSEWWSNILRENGDRGRWLGPRATEMIQFLNNDATAFMTGDNTHMWPVSAYDCPHFGINGAFEDTTNPENTFLYYGNVMLVHAMHQDGLICSSFVGSTSPAYVMKQDESIKYYLKNESDLYGNTDSYVGVVNDSLINVKASMKNVMLDDSFAWFIRYNPTTCMYSYQNVATGKYIANVSGAFKVNDTPSEIQLIPSRSDFVQEGLSKTTYWMLNAGIAMQGSGSLISSSGYSKSNTASRQRWLFLTSSEATLYDEYCSTVELTKLDELIVKVKSSAAIEHVAKTEGIAVNDLDNEFYNKLLLIDQEKNGYTVTRAREAEQNVINAFITLIAEVNPKSIDTPFNLTWMLQNPDFNIDGTGWNVSVAQGYGCGEFYEKTFNLYQNISSILPVGTYKVSMQGFQRPGKASETKTQFDAGTNNIRCYLNLTGANNVYIKNIWNDAQNYKIGTGQTLSIGGLYIPDSMMAANSWFEAGFYNNDIFTTLAVPEAIKIGLRSTVTDVQWWTIFDNFRLYYYGDFTQDEIVTGIKEVNLTTHEKKQKMYNIQGVEVNPSYKGIIIKNGKKIIK